MNEDRSGSSAYQCCGRSRVAAWPLVSLAVLSLSIWAGPIASAAVLQPMAGGSAGLPNPCSSTLAPPALVSAVMGEKPAPHGDPGQQNTGPNSQRWCMWLDPKTGAYLSAAFQYHADKFDLGKSTPLSGLGPRGIFHTQEGSDSVQFAKGSFYCIIQVGGKTSMPALLDLGRHMYVATP
jgi:hypothetical protein